MMSKFFLSAFQSARPSLLLNGASILGSSGKGGSGCGEGSIRVCFRNTHTKTGYIQPMSRVIRLFRQASLASEVLPEHHPKDCLHYYY